MSTQTPLNVHQFDVRGISRRLRHAAIFGALESLGLEDVMRFINDHDPLPLLNQIQQRYDGQVHFEYVQRDPEAVVIDFTIHPKQPAAASADSAAQAGGCGGDGGTCGCQG